MMPCCEDCDHVAGERGTCPGYGLGLLVPQASLVARTTK